MEDFAAVCEWVRVWRVWRPNLPDADDNHVMELAIVGNAAAIVTYNASDYKGAMFAPPGCEITPPGTFLHTYPL
ncbi:MAG: PIN domain-containing protein [Verrucomicrobiota bacterium]